MSRVGCTISLVSLRMAALGLLAQQPGSGYDLLKTFEKSMANVWPATQSQLYGELNKLSDAGLIEVTDIGPRGRKEYRITPDGRTELKRWLMSPQDDPPLRDASLLRVFMLGELEPDEARRHMICGRRARRLRGQATRGAQGLHRLDRRRRPVLRSHRTGIRPATRGDGSRVGASGRRRNRPQKDREEKTVRRGGRHGSYL